MAMNTRTFSRMLLLVAMCLFAQNAKAQIEIPEPGNEAFRALYRLLQTELSNSPPSDSGSNKPLSRMAPEQIWKMAEEAMLLHNRFPTYRQYSTLNLLTQAIELHPKKSEFVNLMLPKIATTSLPTREPNGWNEIVSVGGGGIAGLLISSVTKIAQPEDCRRIVESVLATNDAAKVAKLRVAVRLVSAKDEFEKLLIQHGSGAESRGQNPAKSRTSVPPFPSPDFGKSTNAPAPMQRSESKKGISSSSTRTPSEEPTSSPPWSVIVSLIVAASGLLWFVWLVLKKRS